MIRDDLHFPIVNVLLMLLTVLLFLVVLGNGFSLAVSVMFGVALLVEVVLFTLVVRRDRKEDVTYNY